MKLFAWLRNRFKPTATINLSKCDADMFITIAPDGSKHSFVAGSTRYGKGVTDTSPPGTIIEYVAPTK